MSKNPGDSKNASLGQYHYNTIKLPNLVVRIAAHCSSSELKEKDRTNFWRCKCNRWFKRAKVSSCPICKEDYETK